MHLQRRKRVKETRGEASETNDDNEDNEKRDAWCKSWWAAQLRGGA